MRTLILVLAICLGAASCSTSETMPPPTNLPSLQTVALRPPPDIADDIACRLLSWPLSPERATEILKQTQIFTQPAVYDAGEPTPQIAALNVLLDQPDPLPYLEELARWGGPVGRLYALSAFQIVDPVRRARLAADLRNQQAVVFTQFGCISDEYTVAELVDIVEEHLYGPWFRKARERTYEYFSEPANICMQRTAGGRTVDK